MLRVSSVHVARLTRLRARRVRLGRLGNLGSRMARCARRDNLGSRRARYTRRDNQGRRDKSASQDYVVSLANRDSQDKPASRDYVVSLAKWDKRANRDKPASQDNVVSRVSPMDSCEHRGNRPVQLALKDSLRDSPVNRVRPNRQRPRSRSVLTQPTRKRRVSATNRRPAQFRLKSGRVSTRPLLSRAVTIAKPSAPPANRRS
jgi:hypothetical protein